MRRQSVPMARVGSAPNATLSFEKAISIGFISGGYGAR